VTVSTLRFELQWKLSFIVPFRKRGFIMKKIILTLFILMFLGAPVSVLAGFFPPVRVEIPPMPVGTIEGSAIASAPFSASAGTHIAFSYNFISGEFEEDGCTPDITSETGKNVGQ